jgi:hypothetical protein
MKLTSSDHVLVSGWDWACAQALAYAADDAPVGPWIEAALPGRAAFCMRDVAHQSSGAQILGLRRHVKNMLFRFAEKIAESRDWCTYWEINRDNLPAPVDYISDDDFWYNLPANFDVLDCCYRQYLWTGDADYINDPVFLNFYDRTVADYVARWDVNGDGLLEYLPRYGRRGLGSYDEDVKNIRSGADLLAAQAAAYRAYAHIQELRDSPETARVYRQKAAAIEAIYETQWWSESAGTFLSILQIDGVLRAQPEYGINCFALYFGLVQDRQKLDRALDDLIPRFAASNVESQSYFPEVAYRYGRDEAAYAALRHLMNPTLPRREYPEVSYSVLAAIVTGLMGVTGHADRRQVTTLGRLPGKDDEGRTTKDEAAHWVALDGLAVGENVVAIRHDGNRQTLLHNQSGPDLLWEARFASQVGELRVDGSPRPALNAVGSSGRPESWVHVIVPAGAACTVAVLQM